MEPQKRFISKLQEYGYEIVTDFDMRRCYCFDNKIMTEDGRELNNVDLFYHMNVDERNEHQNSILHALEIAGVKIINPYNVFETTRDKFISNFQLRKAGILVPPSILIASDFSSEIISKLFDEWGSILLKPRRNAGGKGIMKFDCFERFMDFCIASKLFYHEYFLQKFIEFEKQDYRVEFIGDKMVGFYSREKRHSFKTNVQGGAMFIQHQYDEEIIALASNSARALGIPLTIVDMIRSAKDGRLYVLEVNENVGSFVEGRAKQLGMKINNGFEGYDDKKIQMLVDYIDLQMQQKSSKTSGG